MPLSAAASAALFNAGAAGIGFATAGRANKKNRAFQRQENERQVALQREMYAKSRGDALADRDFENAYNSPKQQMQRLKEAGLNPRLIYGGSTGIMAAADTRQASTDTPSGDPQRIDPSGQIQSIQMLGDIMSQYVELTQKQAETDNLRQTKELLEAKTQTELAGLGKLAVDTDLARYNLDYAKRSDKPRMAKLHADLNYTLNEDRRKDSLINAQWQKLEADIHKVNADTQLTQQQAKNLGILYENLQTEGKLKQMEEVFRAHGINPNSDNNFQIILKIIQSPSLMEELQKIHHGKK